jgi:hypothetical protein
MAPFFWSIYLDIFFIGNKTKKKSIRLDHYIIINDVLTQKCALY